MKPFTSIALISSLLLAAGTASAASVDAQLSTRESYVGIPIVLQITIADARNYDQPPVPEIDGCDIRAAGPPAQSSRVTIINGRRSESRSVTLRYLITPRREGTFEIPAMTFQVDGKQTSTRPLRFVATKSETGDLLFVEIEGSQDQVYVGQPLDLVLKIWIKPYRDAKLKLQLSEGDMWQMISDQTSWGGFTERMQQLAANNQRPGGEEVLRDDGQGNERSYYLYEIEAKVYPSRAGKIDAEDVQIVVNYPTSLGRSRSPLSGFFEDSPFGRDPFGDGMFESAVGNRLAVTSSRPIVGEVRVDETKVLPVPAAGRPADYRGAVGRYRIVTQADPTTVAAGDPITLNIGIAGDGPMELVQAPPLAEISALTNDFKVEDQSLAGFVQEDTKLFSTTIRPRKAGITQIPAIPFSFFDPDLETYETVMSDPIAITVSPAEMLALDAIVGSAKSDQSPADSGSASANDPLPDFTNTADRSILDSQPKPSKVQWWWGLVVFPPLLWLITLVGRQRRKIISQLPSLRSAYQRGLTSIGRASDRADIVQGLTSYIENRSGRACASPSSAVGVLRTFGMYGIAGEVELFFQQAQHAVFADLTSAALQQYQAEAIDLLEKLEAGFNTAKRSRIRSVKGKTTRHSAARKVERVMVLVLAVGLAFAATDGIAAQVDVQTDATARNDAAETVQLSPEQQQTILDEAHEAYTAAGNLKSTDSAEAKQLLTTAATKYQLLVDSGIRNSGLYLNLGNAYLQSGRLGRAIAYYELAKQLDPGNDQLLKNLRFANSRVKGNAADVKTTADGLAAPGAVMPQIRGLNDMLVKTVGRSVVIGCLVITSLLFWGLLIARAAGYRFHIWRFAVVPLLLLLVSLGSLALTATDPAAAANGVIVADSVQLNAGDGQSFGVVATLGEAQGRRVEILTTRGDWLQIRTALGDIGWVPDRDVLRIRS